MPTRTPWASALMLYLAGLLGTALLPVSIGIFVVAWIFQFIGHKIEGKKPSFFEDLQYFLVGPLFVMSKLFEAGDQVVSWVRH